MKIAVNTRFLLKNRLEGIGWFEYETLSRIAVSHPEHIFYFIFDRPYDERFIFSDNVKPVVIGPPARHPVLWLIWFQFSLKRALRKIKPDVFVSPDGYLPLGLKIPSLAIIHDIAYEHFPSTVPALVRWYYKYFFPRFAREATRVATVSEFSKSDISELYKVSPDKIDVVYNGIHGEFEPLPAAEIESVRNKWAGGHPYFIFIGALYPRKNLVRLVKAFSIFKSKTGQPVKMLIAGQPHYGVKELKAEIQKSEYSADIHLLGRVEPQSELRSLLGSSLALTYVSLFEGFGIPCLESMKSGVPVITSNTSSMVEVCDGAAILVDPLSPDSISEAMIKIASQPEIRSELIGKGFERASLFSWDKTASLLWNSIEKTVNLQA